MEQHPQLLDINASAKALSISPWTVRAFIREGKIHPIRIGRRVLLETSELERCIAEAQQLEPLH